MKKFLKNKFLVKVRNFLNLKPVKIYVENIPANAPISDFFPWRLDNNFETFFRFSDYPKIFQLYDNVNINIFIFDNEGKLILKKNIENIELSNEIKISDYIKDYGKYGSFLFFFTNQNQNNSISIRNSCYTGFSKSKNLASFSHGNVPVAYLYQNKINYDIVGTSLKKNNIYSIQESFESFDKVELFFSNPTSKKIYFEINGKKYSFKKNQSKIIDVTALDNITIKSNCFFLRPYVFKYKKQFFDFHHG